MNRNCPKCNACHGWIESPLSATQDYERHHCFECDYVWDVGTQ